MAHGVAHDRLVHQTVLTMWRDLVERLEPTASFAQGATDAELAEVEMELGAPLPRDLVSLLKESNGMTGEHGLNLIWSSSRIVSDNLAFRRNRDFAQLYMPFDPLLFFADGGNGDQFALLASIARDDVFVWNHEDDSRSWVAPTIGIYLEWWITGRISI